MVFAGLAGMEFIVLTEDWMTGESVLNLANFVSAFKSSLICGNKSGLNIRKKTAIETKRPDFVKEIKVFYAFNKLAIKLRLNCKETATGFQIGCFLSNIGWNLIKEIN